MSDSSHIPIPKLKREDPLGLYESEEKKFFCMAHRMILGPYSPQEIGMFLVDKSLSYEDLVLDEATNQWFMINQYFEFVKLPE